MGFHLHSALDPERRRDCEANAAALQESLMRHYQKSSRYSAPAGEPTRRIHYITVTPPGEPGRTYEKECVDGLDAYYAARDEYGPGVHITVSEKSWLEQSIGRAS